MKISKLIGVYRHIKWLISVNGGIVIGAGKAIQLILQQRPTKKFSCLDIDVKHHCSW